MPSVADLPWLPPAPAEFRTRLTAALAAERPGDDLRRLATHRLRAADAAFFGKLLRRAQAAGTDLAPLAPVSLGVLSNATADFVMDEIAAAAARHGVAVTLAAAPFDLVLQTALDPDAAINAPGVEMVLVAVDHRWFRLDAAATADPVPAAIEQLAAVVDALKAHHARTIVLQTVAVPPLPLFGGFDLRVAGSAPAAAARLNAAIVELAEQTGSVVLDVARLAAQVGTDAWFDPVGWNLYKLPFASACNAIYADHVGRLLGSLRGRTRKCLVLDLDNTVWGGVVGDDGMAALKIGQGSGEGEAFLAVQQMALSLKSRGIVLAVASKNTDAVAREPFRDHPDMALREADIAVFQANWLDKPSNLEAIARTLNIGLDALVFLDDNAAERAQVRAALPSVAVPELPADAAWYPWFLLNAGYFEAVSFSEEDRLRAASYAANAQRAEVSLRARDLGEYLQSLGMEVSFAPFDAVGRARISQLINKSNQFNLTTRRYTEADVQAFERDERALTLQVRLSDKFGDFGMIGVVIAHLSDAELVVDTWLMSCRVLGRKVEEAMLAELARLAIRAGAHRITGVYIPTEKNSMVAQHYPKLGFTPVGEAAGTTTFHLDLSDYTPPALPHRVTRQEAPSLA